MAEKRQERRHRKRLQVKFGPTSLIKVGFTDNLSEVGLFVKTPTVFSPPSILQLELTTSANEMIVLEGKVVWAKKVPPTLINKTKGGMGILILRFVQGEEIYLRLCQEMGDKSLEKNLIACAGA
ncbi:MAG: PilZ domain-containing protein [Desulfuromonadales bacterium]|nr:PilZ domain-containing protein [Desulfuromonadales bacterium]